MNEKCHWTDCTRESVGGDYYCPEHIAERFWEDSLQSMSAAELTACLFALADLARDKMIRGDR